MSQAISNITSLAASDKAAPRKAKPAAPAAQASARQVATQAHRTVISFTSAQRECPDATQATTIARAFGLNEVDYHAIREATEEQLARSALALKANLSDRAIELHLQRIVDAFVRSAHGAGTFYDGKAKIARDLNSKAANEHRDEDRIGVDGTDNEAERARGFAAMMGLQAFALLAAAEGAVDAYAQVTGSEWKPYAPAARPAMSVERQSAAAQLAALGM